MNETTESISSVNGRWFHRRRMAYAALISCIAIVMYLVRYPDSVEQVGGIVNTFLAGMFAVVMSYCGLATWDDVSARKRPKG